MIAFALALFLFFLILFLGLGFIIWVIKQAAQARQYRILREAVAHLPKDTPSNKWKITFKRGHKRYEAICEGESEGAALKSLIKTGGIGYDKIESIVHL